MKTTYLFFCICMFSGTMLFAQSGKHSISLSVGYDIPFENSIYINNDDPDIEIWADPENDIPFAILYQYKLSDFLKAGAGIEYNKIKFESFYTNETDAKRIAIGIHCLASYPNTSFHAEFGGFGNFGILNSDEFDNSIKGIEYGIMIGPACQTGRINTAIHFQPCFGYYFISGDEHPDDALIMYPRLFAKISYETLKKYYSFVSYLVTFCLL